MTDVLVTLSASVAIAIRSITTNKLEVAALRTDFFISFI
jgi:hypothetical protein